MAKTSAKELFEYYNQGLLECLPMKDITFLEVLKRRNLLPDEMRSSLVQMDKTTERSSYFLEKIIRTGFDNGSDSHFANLLAAMKESNYENVRDLAIEIQSKLGMDPSQDYNTVQDQHDQNEVEKVYSSHNIIPNGKTRDDKPVMRDLHATIVHTKFAIYWKELGSKLGLADHQIEIISIDKNSIKDCCIAMLEEWLGRDNYAPTWGKLSDTINEIEVALETGIGTDVVSIVAVATEQLQQRYINSRFSSSVDEWPPYQPKHYTTLAFIHNKGKFTDTVRFSIAQELAVAGKIHTTQSYKCSDFNASITKSISDIFLPFPDGSFIDLQILIEGAPGIGKTVLAKEIAYRWAKNELLTSKKLLLLVFLRECSQTQLRSIKELVKHVFKNDEMVPQLIKYLFMTDGEDAVIILDGFDELSEENRKESIIVDIIFRRILPKSCLVITSDPTTSSNLHRIVDRKVEIVGFTEEDRLDYIQTALKGNNEQVKALQHYLQSNPTINALCYIPLNMTILLCLAEDGIDKLPKTQTEMYKKFIEMTIVRFIKKHENRTLIIKIGKLPHPHNKLFVELAKLAYNALRIDKIVFTLSEIKENCPNLTITSNNWNGLGLLKAVQYFSVEMCSDQVKFHFLHFSIQEYMAAWYISTLSDNKQIKLLKKTFWEHRYYNTWIMYVGITCGSSFALRHFLSGNWFKFYSKLFKPSKVSKKYLRDKMKCLYLFQCLVEANKEDIIASVTQLFKNNQIDLSNQTLLPSDLNTLGFFLLRSLNKEWDELDLSNCKIGSEGCSILCDRFLDKDVCDIVTIKMVNFSYNQLYFSSIIRLFGLFNSWHTSEIIITDEAILDDATDDKAIEEMILQSSTLTLVLIGLYFFSKNSQPSKVLRVLSNTANIRIMYLLNCSWKFDSETSELLTLLEKQKLDKVRIIGTSLDKIFIKTMALLLLDNNDSVNMFVYDPTMSDEIADDIISVIARLSKDISGVMLIVSSRKVQGIVNTCALSNELSALELLNLNLYITHLSTKMCPWRANLNTKSNNKKAIYTFLEFFYKIDFNWQLQITLIEDDTLIAYKANFRSINKLMHSANTPSLVYGDNTKLKPDVINETCSTLYILDSPDYVKLLHNKLLEKQFMPNELFIYHRVKDSLMNSLVELLSHYHHRISAVLVANDVFMAIHPSNNKQIALAFQLQPSPSICMLSTIDNVVAFYQLIDTLTILHNEWRELDLTGCNIGDIECESMYTNLRFNSYSSTVKKLTISSNKLSVSGISILVKVILIWRVQELTVSGINDFLCNCLIKNLTSESKHQNTFLLSITYNYKIFCIVCNMSWNEIATKANTQASELYIINCDLRLSNSKELVFYLTISHNLSRLCVINGTVSETIIIGILTIFLNKVVEISISNVSIDGGARMTKNFITSKAFCHMKFSLVLSTNQWLCVYNATKYQLHFIQQYLLNQAQPVCHSMSFVSKIEQINGNKMYIFKNDQVNLIHLSAKVHQITGGTQIIAALSKITSLTTIEIDNYSIPSEAAGSLANILQCNTQLQEVHLNGNSLQANDAIKIAKALQGKPTDSPIVDDVTNKSSAVLASKANLEIVETADSVNLHGIFTLIKFSVSNNNITDEAAGDIAAVVSCNIYLQELNLGSNNLQASGIIKIARSLQKISSLTKLYINHNNITHEAADDIAAAISCNNKLQEFDASGNQLQAVGGIKVLKALKGIYTLRKLYLSNIGITDEVADDIAVAVTCNIEMQELDVSRNNLQSKGAMTIAKSLKYTSILEKLYISINETADNIAATTQTTAEDMYLNISSKKSKATMVTKLLIEQLETLTTLNLSGCTINDQGAYMMATVLLKTVSLAKLDLSNTMLNSIRATKINNALKNISSLKVFNINNNEIDDRAAAGIISVLHSNSMIKSMNLSYNKLFYTGILNIAKALSKTIEVFNISSNFILTDNITDLAFVLSKCAVLQELNISQNLLRLTNVLTIAQFFRHHPTLQTLDLSGNTIAFLSACEFIVDVIFSVNHILVYLNVSGRNIKPRYLEDYMSSPIIENNNSRFTLQNLLQYPMINISDTQSNFIRVTETCPLSNKDIICYYANHLGGVFYNQYHNFAIVIPPGAISYGDIVEMKVTTDYFSPYIIPDGFYPISSYFWVSANYEFNISVYFIMNHYAKIRSLDDISNLHLLHKCAHNSNVLNEDLTMSTISDGVYFDYEIGYCVLATDHFCTYCEAKTDKEIPEYLIACYYTYNESSSGSYIAEVCFCPSTFNCKKLIIEQCDKRNTKIKQSVTFDIVDKEELFISYIDNSSVNSHEWKLFKIGKPQIIHLRDFKFWKIFRGLTVEEIKTREASFDYPPRLQIQCEQIDLSKPLYSSFQVSKKDMNVVVAEFPLVKKVTDKLDCANDREKVLVQEPKMWELNKIVIPKIQAHWQDVAYNSLHYDIPKVKAIAEKHQNDPKKCCRELFEEWLSMHKEGDSKSWGNLLEMLKEVEEITAIVEKISKEVKKHD